MFIKVYLVYLKVLFVIWKKWQIDFYIIDQLEGKKRIHIRMKCNIVYAQ